MLPAVSKRYSFLNCPLARLKDTTADMFAIHHTDLPVRIFWKELSITSVTTSNKSRVQHPIPNTTSSALGNTA